MTRRLTGFRGLGLTVVVIIALVAFPFMGFEGWVVTIGTFTLMYAALGTSWNFLGGMTGYLSLGNVAFFGLGAYTLGIIMEHLNVGSGWTPFALVLPIGVAVGLASVPFAFVAFRSRGLIFMIVTIAFVLILEYLAYNLISVTGGASGLQLPTAPFGPNAYLRNFYYGMLGIFLLALAVSGYVKRTRLGLIMNAIREDEDKAKGLGISVMAPKYIAFAVSAGLSAMVGAVWAYDLGIVYPQFAFDPEFLTIGIVVVVFLGGIGSLWGPFVGAVILLPPEQYLSITFGSSQYYLLAYAMVFIVVMRFLPRGAVTTLLDRIRRGEQRRRVERWSDVPTVVKSVDGARAPEDE